MMEVREKGSIGSRFKKSITSPLGIVVWIEGKR